MARTPTFEWDARIAVACTHLNCSVQGRKGITAPAGVLSIGLLMTSVEKLRKCARRSRRALTPRERAEKSRAVCRHIHRSAVFRRTYRLALYAAAPEEVDLSALARHAWCVKKAVFLPVLRPYRPPRLWFGRWIAGRRLRPNRYGTLEPPARYASGTSLHALSVVLTPVVAFDAAGNRIGMGKGYYDRSFAFRHHRGVPRLVGVAFDCQRVHAIPARPWDVPLDAIVTENGVFTCARAGRNR